MEHLLLLGIKIDMINDGIRIGTYSISKESIYNFGLKIIQSILIILMMVIVIKIGSSIIDRMTEKQKKFKFSLDERKSQTFGAVLKSILRYSVYFMGIFTIAEKLFGTVGLTLAGIGGVAVGFGAQSLVKDIINGFFILFEDQFSVGDYINVDDKGGIVESIELRVTKIRGLTGDLHIIPNGLITKVTNHSRGNIGISVDFEIAYDADLDKTILVIEELCTRFQRENQDMTEGPEVLGISSLKETGIIIRVSGKVKPMTQWTMEMKLRKEVRDALRQADIEMPFQRARLVKE
ncbi:MAG: mechanosensitive ion channel family protein [Solirubrobacterales bacterium]